MESVLVVINTLLLIAVVLQALFTREQVKEMRLQFAEQRTIDADRFHAQLSEAIVARRLDHDRRTKQATIENWASAGDSRLQFRTLVFSRFGTDALTEAQVDELVGQRHSGNELDNTANALMAYLDGLDWFAAGVNAEVFDLDTADALCGSSYIDAYACYRKWIKQSRIDRDRPTQYGELATLAAKLSDRRTGSRTVPVLDPDGTGVA